MDPTAEKANAVMAVVFAVSLVAIAVFSLPKAEKSDFEVPTSPMAMVDENIRIGFADPELKSLATKATAQITYPWQENLPGWTIQFISAQAAPSKARIAGYTWSAEQHIEVFVRPGDDEDSLARVLAHELGHAVDVTLNSGDERRAWLDQRQATTDDWWPAAGRADFSAGAGDFAEAFAFWQLRDTQVRTEISGTPTAADLALLVRLARQ